MAPEKKDDAVAETPKEETESKKKTQKLLRVDQIYSKKDRQTHFVKTAPIKPRLLKAGRKVVLVVRRIINKDGQVSDIEIDIKSEILVSVMRDIFDGVKGIGLSKEPPVCDRKTFFHARKELQERLDKEKKKNSPDQGLIDDVGVALQFIEEDFSSTKAELEALLAKGEITFDLLWCLFPPKEVVYASTNGQLGESQAMYMSKAGYACRQGGCRYLFVSGSIISHDGEDFGWTSQNFEIDDFDGVRSITDLEIYPFKLHPDPKALEHELISRGKKFVSLVKEPVCKEYALPSASTLIFTPDGRERLVKTGITGRVVIDPYAFRFYGNLYSLNTPWVNTKNSIKDYDSLSDKHFLVCASWVNGFCLSSKVWARFMVSQLREVTWNDEAFTKLQIAESRRRIIHGLVRAHKNDESTFDDFVQNKGKGMVGLLSGNPGVGKTLTAEVVAEVTRRPLYMASGGELGMDPDSVDKRLATILEITRRWSAVLLIDEADVFLTVRGKTIAQDTLVSIFLRRIEYFQGVLILTTNRREEIDPAFESRIHFRLHYPDLEEDKRRHIWKIFLEKNTDLLLVDDDDIAELAKRPLNGRQIKNATSCALSLARDGNKQLNMDDIVELLDVIIN